MVEVLYLVLFLFLRGIVGSVAMYWIFTSSFFDLEEKIMSLSLYIVSIIFIFDIARYIRYKYKKENVSWFCFNVRFYEFFAVVQ